MATNADGRVRRTDTAACRFLHRPFDNAILKRVKRDNREPPARTKCVYRIAERVRQDRQLLIDLDANRLKNPLCGMPSFCAHRLRHGTVDDGDEFARCRNGTGFARLLNKRGNALCPSFLTVCVKDLRKFLCAVFVDNGIGTARSATIHTHIERRVLHIGKTALRRVNLRRRDAKIKEDAVHLNHTFAGENRREAAEVIAYKRHLTRCIRETLLCCCNRNFVLIDADETAFRRKLPCNPPRVPCPAKRAVHIDTVRTHRKCFNRFFRQNTDVMKVAHIVIP